MVDEPKLPLIVDAPHAPFIFFENAPMFSFMNGVVCVTLSANRTWIDAHGVANEQVVVAYLRGNVQAARGLRDAIDRALLMGAPPEGKGQTN
jgi:hypothetical protein